MVLTTVADAGAVGATITVAIGGLEEVALAAELEVFEELAAELEAVVEEGAVVEAGFVVVVVVVVLAVVVAAALEDVADVVVEEAAWEVVVVVVVEVELLCLFAILSSLLATAGFSEWTCSIAVRSLLNTPSLNFGASE
jgi:NAD(P)H-dependent flavin oxidoreductase YrpB (nitropropane dioxygenase family)